MSTRSYVGIIENGEVRYGYHHSDSHLESLGIELFTNITSSADIHKLPDYAEVKSLEAAEIVTENTFFTTPARDIFIEFCYGFNVEDETWYVSSCHFTNSGEVHKLLDVVQNDTEMNRYLSMYYEEYRESILKQIRENIK